MPRLSLWRPHKANDYKFFDRRISEMFTVGGVDVNIHKYLGPIEQGFESNTEPGGSTLTSIQDLLFLENRDRKYDQDVYTMRTIYRVNDNDFDLTQFGLFLTGDTMFAVFHLNDMIDTFGRKIIVGDVLELPNMKDLYPLDDDIPTALKRYYVVEDVNRAAEGFSQTWYPHLYRVKLKQIYDGQEFSEILDLPAGDDANNTLRDVLSTFETEMQINNAVVAQADADSAKSGYDTSNLYTLQVDNQGRPELVTTDTNELDASQADLLADRVSQTPAREGYQGYLLGDNIAPNGESFGSGIQFPNAAQTGDYFLRTDMMPNRLFRYDNSRWIKVEDGVRMTLSNTDTRTTLKTGFVNNSTTSTIGGDTVVEKQSLSKALKPKADN